MRGEKPHTDTRVPIGTQKLKSTGNKHRRAANLNGLPLEETPEIGGYDVPFDSI